METCIFCDIVEGKLSSHIIHEDDDCIVILDRYPIDYGHSLIITKKPYEKITDMKQDEVAKYVAKKLGIPEELIRSQEEMQQAVAQMQQLQQMQPIQQVESREGNQLGGRNRVNILREIL